MGVFFGEDVELVATAPEQREVITVDADFRLLCLADLQRFPQRLLRHGAQHDIALLGDDSYFFLENGGNGLAQQIGMLQLHVGQHLDLGINDVGGVVTATEARFDHGDIHLLLPKVEKRGGGQDLKLSERTAAARTFVDLFRLFSNIENQFVKTRLGNILAVYLKSFREGDQVR